MYWTHRFIFVDFFSDALDNVDQDVNYAVFALNDKDNGLGGKVNSLS